MILLLFLVFFIHSKNEDIALALPETATIWKGTADSYVYIGTADGRIHAIDIYTGKVIWSIDTGGKTFESAECYRSFIPSIDGFLFTYLAGSGFGRFPLPISDLVYLAPFCTASGELFISEKTTSIFNVTEQGEIISCLHANSTKRQNGTETNAYLTITRTKYILNIYEQDTPNIVKYSEFELLTNSPPTNVQSLTVTTTFSGEIYISFNDTHIIHLSLDSYVTSVFGSHGKFDFHVDSNDNDDNNDTTSITIFADIDGNTVAIPSKPISISPTVQTETEASRAIYDSSQQPDNSIQLTYNEVPVGKFDATKIINDTISYLTVTNYRSITGNVQINQTINNQSGTITTTTTFSFLAFSSSAFHWPVISVILITIFFLLNLLQVNYKNKHSLQIEIDPTDESHGTFNNQPCSVLKTTTVDESTFKDICDFNIQYTVQIKAYEKRDDCLLIAVNPLVQWDFNDIQIDEINNIYCIKSESLISIKSFLKRMITVILALFNHGYIHGSISLDSFFADSSNEVILGGFEKKCCHYTDPNQIKDDVLSLALAFLRIINLRYLEITNECVPVKSDNEYKIAKKLIASSDPILYDLIAEMTCPDVNDRSTPMEVLKHPYFLNAEQKLDIFKRANEFLNSKNSRDNGLLLEFNSKSREVVGVNWSQYIDKDLINDARNHSGYSYSYTSASDLVRLIRNKWEHKTEKTSIMSLADSYFNYFHHQFPNLFLYTYYFIDKYFIAKS